MLRTRVGVLRGGPSNEYEVSLRTGKTVLDHLPGEVYRPIDIYIDRSGMWHRSGVPSTNLHEALRDIDVVFNALHGEFGEDGHLQQLLDHLKMPYTGSGALASAIGMNKALSKKYFAQANIRSPHHRLISVSDDLPQTTVEIFRTFPQPCVVKPYNCGSSIGVTIVKNFKDLESGISKSFEYAPQVLIEEYIAGKEGTMGVIENFRDREYYPLLPIEIRPKERDFFDYEAKYNGASDEISPGNFSKGEFVEIERAVILAHKTLGARHYSRTDFIVHPRRGVFILEINTLPGLTEESLFPKSLKSIGVKLSDFLHHIISLAKNERRQ